MAVSFNFVTERIAVGGGISSKPDVDQIVAAGITRVIDMRAEFDDAKQSRKCVCYTPHCDCSGQGIAAHPPILALLHASDTNLGCLRPWTHLPRVG